MTPVFADTSFYLALLSADDVLYGYIVPQANCICSSGPFARLLI